MIDVINTRKLFVQFSEGPQDDVRVFFAPGRVNLIGEHTDYNGGHVFPAALELGTWAIVRPRKDNKLRFASTSFPGVVEVSTDAIKFAPEDDYANYPKGVAWVLQQEGMKLHGADILFDGNLPNGAGLSSSASIEVVTAAALNALANGDLTNERMAIDAQRAENEFVGVNCGIMDQFAVAMGKQHHALSLNCATLEYQLVPLTATGYRFIITNTNKRRGLADSKYNERRSECEQALAEIQKVRPDVKWLADLTPADWPMVDGVLKDDVLKRRAHHVIFENHRAVEAVQTLRAGDLHRFGEMMNESHRSLRDDYEVTGRELDALAAAAWEVPGCIGSRMTGAGFGGCTVSLVEIGSVDMFQETVQKRYTDVTGLVPSFYVSDIGDGVREVTEEVMKQWQC